MRGKKNSVKSIDKARFVRMGYPNGIPKEQARVGVA